MEPSTCVGYGAVMLWAVLKGVVCCLACLQHKPSGNAQLSKPVKQALRAVGITFFLLPTDLQQQHEDTLVQVSTSCLFSHHTGLTCFFNRCSLEYSDSCQLSCSCVVRYNVKSGPTCLEVYPAGVEAADAAIWQGEEAAQGAV